MYTITTRPQSLRLIDAGLPADTADFHVHHNGTYTSIDFPTDHPYTPAWSLGRLLQIVPARIYSLNCNGEIREFDIKLWKIPAYRCKDDPLLSSPERYGMTYTTFSVLPPDHPISPLAPYEESLYDADGCNLHWSSPDPIEMLILAIEWLSAAGHPLSTDPIHTDNPRLIPE